MVTTVKQLKEQLNISDSAFIGLFLCGSQNYGLDSEASDKDYICIVTDFNLSYQTVHINNSQIKVYSACYFLRLLQAGDLECLECLYTDQAEINPHYYKVIRYIKESLLNVLDYNNVIASLNKKLKEHISYLYIHKANDSPAAQYSRKRLYWAIRVGNQLERIMSGESFATSLKYPEDLHDELLKIKTIENYLDSAQVQTIENHLKELMNKVAAIEGLPAVITNNFMFEILSRFKELKYMADIKN